MQEPCRSCERRTGRMVTTMGPRKRPAGLQASVDTNIGTVVPCSTCRRGTPAYRKAPLGKSSL